MIPRNVSRHLMAIGVIGLLIPVYTPTAIIVLAGCLFGVGFTGWLFHRVSA